MKLHCHLVSEFFRRLSTFYLQFLTLYRQISVFFLSPRAECRVGATVSLLHHSFVAFWSRPSWADKTRSRNFGTKYLKQESLDFSIVAYVPYLLFRLSFKTYLLSIQWSLCPFKAGSSKVSGLFYAESGKNALKVCSFRYWENYWKAKLVHASVSNHLGTLRRSKVPPLFSSIQSNQKSLVINLLSHRYPSATFVSYSIPLATERSTPKSILKHNKHYLLDQEANTM